MIKQRSVSENRQHCLQLAKPPFILTPPTLHNLTYVTKINKTKKNNLANAVYWYLEQQIQNAMLKILSISFNIFTTTNTYYFQSTISHCTCILFLFKCMPHLPLLFFQLKTFFHSVHRTPINHMLFFSSFFNFVSNVIKRVLHFPFEHTHFYLPPPAPAVSCQQ